MHSFYTEVLWSLTLIFTSTEYFSSISCQGYEGSNHCRKSKHTLRLTKPGQVFLEHAMLLTNFIPMDTSCQREYFIVLIKIVDVFDSMSYELT